MLVAPIVGLLRRLGLWRTPAVLAAVLPDLRLLRELIARWDWEPKVELITTDGFLYPNAELQRRGILHRKGFPESYDRRALLQFVADFLLTLDGKPAGMVRVAGAQE